MRNQARGFRRPLARPILYRVEIDRNKGSPIR